MTTSAIESWDNFLKNAHIGVHVVAGNGTIMWANQAELDALGYSEDEYFGKHISEFHADPDVIDKILGLLAGGDSLHAYPARLFAADGSIKHVLINSNVFWDGDDFVHTRCFTNGISIEVYRQLRLEMDA